MITKAQVKHIHSLVHKKYRQAGKQFIVEGKKLVEELTKSKYHIDTVYHTSHFKGNTIFKKSTQIECIEEFEMQKISQLKTPTSILALVDLPLSYTENMIGFSLLLDNIQDPGNVGTIIRIADWFNIQHLILHQQTADVFQPKVVQASMGSLFNVQCIYRQTIDDALNISKTKKIYAAVLQGTDMRKIEKNKDIILVIGNESNGIQSELREQCEALITIPQLGNATSLNASVACGILCAHLLL